MVWYRLMTSMVLWPLMAMMWKSSMPARRASVTKVWRKSWNRSLGTPALSQAHANRWLISVRPPSVEHEKVDHSVACV